MPEPGPNDAERLDRLRDLSNQISAAMTELLAFQTRVTTALVEIERVRAKRFDDLAHAGSRPGPGGGTRKRAKRAA